jgi:hypothetical protein
MTLLKLALDGREVIDPDVQRDSSDYPDFADAYFFSARFADTGEDLNDEQLDKLAKQNSDALHVLAHRTARYGGFQ